MSIIESPITSTDFNPKDAFKPSVREVKLSTASGGTVAHVSSVEAPETWSDQAVMICTTKYFRGAEGSRETSIYDMVRRVTSRIAEQASVLIGEKDALQLQRDLEWLILSQRLTFNSPVWFNVGAPDPTGQEQVSACFLEPVEDTLDSIMRLATTMSTIFKSGSGVGSNLSRIRSKDEFLSSGGRPSGPLSFMGIYNSVAGVVKSGGRSRRAAILMRLDCDHPDVEEFITSKAKEEVSVRKMIEEAGFSANFWEDDSAYSRASYQNMNISVGISDAFMQAAESGAPWELKARTTGETLKTVSAAKLLREIAEAAWQCGDPGVQFDDAINAWNTCPRSGRINMSNPCSEVFFLDHASCNLAVINLIKFWDGRKIDTDLLATTVQRAILAQDILCELGTYPTPEIEKVTKEFRPLGLGFTNLGGLLMAMGIPYDSDEARAVARGIASFISAHAYLTSAKMAEAMGPFKHWSKNKKPFLRVLERHKAAAAEMRDTLGLCEASVEIWSRAIAAGKKCGFRNSQVTCQMPAGTTSFMLDSDTTGIEPEISLVRTKYLVGGGAIKLVNRVVPIALEQLGYADREIQDILKYVEENGTVEGCPVLKPEHEPVFHCAYPAKPGGQCISPRGHLLMLAAVQPAISGGISKTIAVPHETTVEGIEEIFKEAWRLGLKSVTVYRDGSKASQPVSVSGNGKNGNGRKKPDRERLPITRSSITHKFSVGGHDGYITVGTYEDGRPGEVFLVMNKEGSVIRGLMDAFAITLSVGLQHGIPLDCFCRKLEHMRFDPSGITGNPEIPFAKSPVDYIARWLSQQFGSEHSDDNGNGKKPSIHTDDGRVPGPDSTVCAECGSMMLRTGACHTCVNCGSTTSCG